MRWGCSRKLLFDMIDIDEIDGGLRVVDAAKNEMEIEIDGWEPGGEELEIDRPVDERISGAARRLIIPGSTITVQSARKAKWRTLSYDDYRDIPPDEHLVQIDGKMHVFLRVNSGFSIRSDQKSNRVTVEFSSTTSLSFGFRSHDKFPSEIIRVPPSPEGVAGALTTLGLYHRTETPDRSYPSMRLHPPSIEVTDEVSIDEIGPTPQRPIQLRLPNRLSVLYSASPLAYYLGASVTVDDDIEPTLIIDTTEHPFAGLENFSEDVVDLLARVFYLDCLVRNAGPYEFDLQEMPLLKRLPIDPDAMYSQPMDERLTEYLSTPYELISSALPEWPLAISMKPTLENLPAIPHLANQLSLIFPPHARTLDEHALLDKSLGDFYRSTVDDDPPRISQTNVLLEPASEHGTVKGWIADGTTVDAFNCPPEAFSNRLEYLGQDPPFTAAVILNDGSMGSEYTEVVSVYEDRSMSDSIDLDVKRYLSTKELASVFRDGYDFIHYIGHCDPEGLRCQDGNLSMANISDNNVQSFFLNACRSFEEGIELIENGSVAGAVTIGDVLDEQAKKVGKTLAEMISRGYSLIQSVNFSRGKAIMNRHYTVVGDGMFKPTSSNGEPKPIVYASAIEDGRFRLNWQHRSPEIHGGVFQARKTTKPVLIGKKDEDFLFPKEFESYLDRVDYPIIYEDSFYWPDELLEELT